MASGVRALTGLLLKRAGQKGEEIILGMDWSEKREVALRSNRGAAKGARLMIELLTDIHA